MAIYKYDQFFSKSSDVKFDTLHEPGEAAPHPGIYRCEGCAHEISTANGHTLPPQNHHQHTTTQGRIRWRLIAWG